MRVKWDRVSGQRVEDNGLVGRWVTGKGLKKVKS